MSGCGSGSCGCADTPSASKVLSDAQQAAYDAIAVSLAPEPAPVQAAQIPTHVRLASVNGVALHEAGVLLDQEALRQRACTELLRQEAQKAGLLEAGDVPLTDGSTSEVASLAIERLLELQLCVDEPSEDACRRYYEAHPAAFGHGERVHLRHVLFAVTPGVDVKLLRLRAEALLIELRCADDGGVSFAAAAKQWSNCPSGAAGGDLGWLTRSDCAPEFARDVFGASGTRSRRTPGVRSGEKCGRAKPAPANLGERPAAVLAGAHGCRADRRCGHGQRGFAPGAVTPACPATIC